MSYFVHTVSKRKLLEKGASNLDEAVAAYLNAQSAQLVGFTMADGNVTMVFHAPPPKK